MEIFKKAKRSGILGAAAKTSQEIEDRGGARVDLSYSPTSNIPASPDKDADNSAEQHKKRLRKYRDENP